MVNPDNIILMKRKIPTYAMLLITGFLAASCEKLDPVDKEPKKIELTKKSAD